MNDAYGSVQLYFALVRVLVLGCLKCLGIYKMYDITTHPHWSHELRLAGRRAISFVTMTVRLHNVFWCEGYYKYTIILHHCPITSSLFLSYL